MKNCIRIPRIYLPVKEFREWAVIACDQHSSDRQYWEEVAKEVDGEPSTLSFILPEAFLGSDQEEKRIQEIHESMYAALEENAIYKLDRGFVYTKRTTQSGERKGLLVALDLEEYSYEEGAECLIRATEAVVPSRLPPRVAVRRGAPLEFPHAMVFYNDPKNKINKLVDGKRLQQVYDFDLMQGGGHIEGYFLPMELSMEVSHELMRCADPCFAVADGNHSIAAAKAYWEEVKAQLKAEEMINHPARFTLVELVNVYDEAIVFHPIHRMVKNVNADKFCEFFQKNAHCTRKGNMLYPKLKDAAEGVRFTDSLIAQYMQENGEGEVDYIHNLNELTQRAESNDCVGIVMKGIEKEDIFNTAKMGKRFPKKTFSVGEENEKRYYLEGREISYD